MSRLWFHGLACQNKKNGFIFSFTLKPQKCLGRTFSDHCYVTLGWNPVITTFFIIALSL